MYKNILIATDGSKFAGQALKHPLAAGQDEDLELLGYEGRFDDPLVEARFLERLRSGRLRGAQSNCRASRLAPRPRSLPASLHSSIVIASRIALGSSVFASSLACSSSDARTSSTRR